MRKLKLLLEGEEAEWDSEEASAAEDKAAVASAAEA
jgi:hypothetical protein